MSSDKKLFKENGFLTEDGKEAFAPVSMAIDRLLSSKEVSYMTEGELRVIGSNLASLVGNKISNYMQAKRDLTKKYASMTDQEFEAFLRAKYGPQWLLVTLTKEELDRIPIPPLEEIRSIAKGLK